jgi:hypothetical protein
MNALGAAARKKVADEGAWDQQVQRAIESLNGGVRRSG